MAYIVPLPFLPVSPAPVQLWHHGTLQLYYYYCYYSNYGIVLAINSLFYHLTVIECTVEHDAM